MKRIAFSRKAILRAIHAACVALFLLAAASEAHAQIVTAPFTNVSGTTYSTQPGTFSSGTFYDPSAPYTVSVGSTTTINATTASHGGFTQFNNAGTNIGIGGGTFTNNGTLSLTLSNGGGYASTVALYGSASGADSTVINSGTLQATSTAGPSMAAISFDNSDGGAGSPPPAYLATSFTLNNTGTLSGTSSGYGFGVHAGASGSGSITITNSSTGVISGSSSGNYAEAIYAHNNTGAVSVTNAGMITAAGGTGIFRNIGIDAVSGGGSSSADNQSTGQIVINDPNSTRLDQAINISGGTTASGSNAGSISITAGQGSAFGLSVHADGTTATATNTGEIILNFARGGEGMSASAYYGTVTATNTGTIQVTGTGSGYYGMGLVANGITVSVVNNGSVTVSGVYNATGITANNGSSGQSLTVQNTGPVTVSGSGSAYGISVSGYTAPIVVTNSGTISATSSGIYAVTGILATTYSQYYATDYSGPITITNSGAVTATNTGSAYAASVSAYTGGDVSVTNTAAGVLTATSSSGAAYGIKARSTSGSVQIGNAAAIDVTSTGGDSTGITATSATTGSVTNSGAISSNSQGGGATGILMNGGAATLTNSGAISATGLNGADGFDVVSTSADISITNSAASIQATSTNGTASAIYLYTHTGTGTVTNSGALTSTSGSNAYGIYAKTFSSDTPNYNITNSAAIHATTTGSSGYFFVGGIYVNGGFNVQVTNQGAITLTGTGSHDYATAITAHGGTVSISNSAPLLATTSGGASYGIYASSSISLSVRNTQTISAISASGYARGIFANSFSPVTTIANSGFITVSGGEESYGIVAESSGANISLTNSAEVTVTSSANTASGLYASAPNGSITLTNSGHVSATSQSGAYTASGIYSKAGSGSTTITNSGYAGGFNTNEGVGYGIHVDPTGPIVVNNTGTAKGTTTGIYLQNAGTVNNSGLASGGVYSIYVPTGSTVNLNGASPVLGLLKGGPNDTSTSLLNFNLAISGNRLAVDEAALNAAIAQYNTALTNAPHGPGHDVDSEVVTINGVAYQWEDFFGIADNLVQGRLYGGTPGYQGVGSAVDNFSPGSARADAILAALDNLPDSGVADALAQLSPKALQVFRNIAFDGASFTAANVNNHLANLRDGLTGFDTSGFTVNTPGVDPTLTQMRSRLLAFNPAPLDPGLLSDSTSPLFGAFDLKDTKAMVNTQPVDRWSAFISGSVILANLDNTTSNIGDSDYTTGSILAGVDYRLDEHLTVGAAFNYAHTKATLDGNGSQATVDTYAPGIYASYVNKGWYGNAMLMYGFNNDSEDRHITIPGLQGVNSASSDGGQGTANMTGGYEFQRGNFKFGPVASLQYVHLTVGSFQEDGPTSLSIDRQEADSLRTQLGFEIRYSANVPTCYGPLELTPHFQASWQHEYMDNSDGITSQFNAGAGGGSFVVQGQQPERDSAFLDLGVDAQVAKNVTLFLDYQTQAGQNNFFAQSAQGGVRIGF